VPEVFKGVFNTGFMFLPKYRAWVIVASLVVCLSTWYVIERTKLGAYLRAATENPSLVQAFGINVPRMITLTYGFGVGLAALAGVMAAPIYQVNPTMGADLIIVVFAVVVYGFDHGRYRHRFRSGPDRGPDQGVLPRGLGHRDLRDHDHCPAPQARRPVRHPEVTP
jgi:hypothetical protein